jgi:calmodulin-regulated spectrin-associated protein 1 (fragment)
MSFQAKQRASILWLLSKAYNNDIPPELCEPYYKNHDDQERLKPQIVQGLASAELYCLALANIYADPNYHVLNHHGIMQLLTRKGIYVIEPHDSSLTETTLIQTTPIRMVWLRISSPLINNTLTLSFSLSFLLLVCSLDYS